VGSIEKIDGPVVSDGELEGNRPKINMLPKTKINGAAPAHTRSEVRRERDRDNAAELEKLQREVATRLRVASRALIGSGFAFAET
jgi:hypothetical protein